MTDDTAVSTKLNTSHVDVDDNGDAQSEEARCEVVLFTLKKQKITTTTISSFLPKKKKLLVLDLNGLLIHRALIFNKSEIPLNRPPDFVHKRRHVYRRPFLEEFITFCLERFEVGIWSSAQERNIEGVLDNILKDSKKRLLFIWDQNQCSNYGFKSLEKKHKPLFFKDLRELWQSYQFSESNTLLIDDEPYKALLNPPNTGIFPVAYDAGNLSDNVLDPKSELGLYLDNLANAVDVPTYVKEHPFGQPAIGPQHPDWEFYSIVLHHSSNSSNKLAPFGGMVKEN